MKMLQANGEVCLNRSPRFILYEPTIYQEDFLYPLVVHLHHAGFKDNIDHLDRTIFAQNYCLKRKKFKFIGVSPFSDGDIFNPYDIKVIIDYMIENYPVDPKKIHITGFSMGGRGAWDFSFAFPEIPRSISTICAVGSYLRSHLIKAKKVFIFHTSKDNVVQREESIKMYGALTDIRPDVYFYNIDYNDHMLGETIYSSNFIYKKVFEL